MIISLHGCLSTHKVVTVTGPDNDIVFALIESISSLLEIRNLKPSSHGKRQKGNDKRKRCAAQNSNTFLNNLSTKLMEHGRHAMLSFLSSLTIPVLCILEIEASRFYDGNDQIYEAALLARCYTQHALHPLIDSEINHKIYFIKLLFINKGFDFLD